MKHHKWRRKEETVELQSKIVSLGHNRSNMHGKGKKAKVWGGGSLMFRAANLKFTPSIPCRPDL